MGERQTGTHTQTHRLQDSGETDIPLTPEG